MLIISRIRGDISQFKREVIIETKDKFLAFFVCKGMWKDSIIHKEGLNELFDLLLASDNPNSFRDGETRTFCNGRCPLNFHNDQHEVDEYIAITKE